MDPRRMARRIPLLVLLCALACRHAPVLMSSTPYVDRANLPLAPGDKVQRTMSIQEPGTILRATVEVLARHPHPTELGLRLTSPDGTQLLLDARIAEGHDDIRYALPLLDLQGETVRGTWRLDVANRGPAKGTLTVWALSFEANGP